MRFYSDLIDIIRHSRATCFRYYSETHTYTEMYENICRINFALSNISDTPIALYAEKSFENYCCLFAILLSGNTWVPISPEQPYARIKNMLSIAKPRILMVDEELPDEIANYADDNEVSVFLLSDLLDQKSSLIPNPNEIDPSQIAYIMFTSGSTGIPKGVPVSHRNYINFIENVLAILKIDQKQTFSDFHDLGFDISIFYLFCSVLTESALVPFKNPSERTYPIDCIVSNEITVWSSVPSSISRLMLLRPTEAQQVPIELMFLCGEPLRLDVMKYCFVNLGIHEIYNFYGLTETGVENFFHKCELSDFDRYKTQGFAPIGRVMSGNRVTISEDKELLICGDQIISNYLGGEGSDRFIDIDGETWFKTGDIVERHGNVYFCKGRLDSQIKIAGYRVELMDVEAQIRNYPGITEAVCFTIDRDTIRYLLCGFTCESDSKIEHSDLKLFLKTYLPSYMVPSKYFALEKMPLNNNGKVDRKKVRTQCPLNL